MKLLANIRIRNKLALMVLCPLLAVVYFSVSGVWEKWDQAREMESLLAVSDLAVKTSALVHESQKERGATALFLGSRGARFQAELSAQRAETDKRVAALKEYLRGFDRGRFGGGLAKSLDDALARVDKTRATREAVSALKITAADGIGHYTEMNAALLAMISRVTHLSGQGELTRRLTAYVELPAGQGAGRHRAGPAEQRVRSGRVRAWNAPAVPRRPDRAGDVCGHVRVPGFRSGPGVLPEDHSRPGRRGCGPDETGRARPGGHREIRDGSAYWFKAMTEKINLMKQVEDRLSEGLVAQAQGLRSRAWAALAVLLAIGAGTVGAASLVVYALVRSITRPIGSVLGTMRELAEGEGDLTRRIPVAGRDELGELALAFNTLHGQAPRHHRAGAGTRPATAATASRELSAAARPARLGRAGAGLRAWRRRPPRSRRSPRR